MQCINKVNNYFWIESTNSIYVRNTEINFRICNGTDKVYFCNLWIENSIRILVHQKTDLELNDKYESNEIDITQTNQYALVTKKQNGNNILKIDYKPFAIKLFYENHIILKFQCFIKLDNILTLRTKFYFIKNLYGLPERASASRLIPGKTYRLYNTDEFLLAMGTDKPLYGSVPFLIGSCNHHSIGLLLQNQSEIKVKLYMTKEFMKKFKIVSEWISNIGDLDLTCFISKSVLDVRKLFMTATGNTPLPPLFALGYHQCRWNYEDQQDMIKVDTSMDKAEIPYDSIWLDIEHTDGKRYMTWDTSKFNPLELVQYLKMKNRHLVVIIDPHLKVDEEYIIYREAKDNGYLIKDEDGESVFVGDCWPTESSWVDFLNNDACEWWANKIANYLKSLDCSAKSNNIWVWNDMNEPSVFKFIDNQLKPKAKHVGNIEHREVHNIYGQNMAKSSWKGILLATENQLRPFLLSRSFFTGSQKYGAIWTGDTEADWKQLQVQVAMMNSLSICGIDFCGSDVGGFFGDPDMELLTRWYQLGTLQPFFRAHSHIDSKRREPYIIEDPYQDAIKKAINFRYRILAYIYLCFWEAEKKNLPITSPVWMYYPYDQNLSDDEMFMIGSDILARPVVISKCKSISFILPDSENIWFQYSTDSSSWMTYQGQQKFTIPISLESLPIFYRGATCIFMKDDHCSNSLEWRKLPYYAYVFPISNHISCGQLYIDDYATYEYQMKNQYLLFRLIFNHSEKSITLNIVEGEFNNQPIVQKLTKIIIIKNKSMLWSDYNAVSINGISEEFTLTQFKDRIEISNLNVDLNQNYLFSFS